MAPKTSDDTNANRVRWGGLLTLCAVLVIAARVTLEIALSPAGLDPDNAKAAAFLTANAGLYTFVSWLGMAGATLAATGAFFLVTRPTATTRSFPASSFWLVIAMGQLLSLGLFAFRGSGMMTLAANQAQLPVAFEAARATTGVLGPVATIMIYGGLAAVFAGEARSRTSAAPAWLCWGVSVAATVGLAGGLLRLVPESGTLAMVLGYAFYAVALGLVLWSVKVAWPRMSLAWDVSGKARTDEA